MTSTFDLAPVTHLHYGIIVSEAENGDQFRLEVKPDEDAVEALQRHICSVTNNVCQVTTLKNCRYSAKFSDGMTKTFTAII